LIQQVIIQNTNHSMKQQSKSLKSCSFTDVKCRCDCSNHEKTVSFATSAKLWTYHTDPTEDSRRFWYSAADNRQFRLTRQLDASMVAGRHPNDLDEEIECFWGLENLIVPHLAKKILDTRARIWGAVLAEHKLQIMQSRYDPDDISSVSIVHTQWSSDLARKKALFYGRRR